MIQKKNSLPIARAAFNGILISGAIIPLIFIIFVVTGVLDLTFLTGGVILPDYELVCFDPDQCFLRLDGVWYIVTDVATPGSIPPELQPLSP